MKKIILTTLSLLVGVSLVAFTKSSASAKELLRLMNPILKNAGSPDHFGHIPYTTKRATPASWQSGTGTKKIFIMMVEFPDEEHTIDNKLFEDVWISDKRTSIKKYYDTLTNGNLTVDLGSHGTGDWIKLKKDYIHYLIDNDIDMDKIIDAIVSDAEKIAFKSVTDMSEYDSDGNGLPDITVILLPGDSLTVGGYMLGDFTFTTSERTIVMVGEDTAAGPYNSPTLIHELGHAMIPVWDLYDYSYTSDPMKGWDVMAGTWEGHCGMCAYTRWKAGWMDVTMIDKPGEYSLDDVNGDGSNKAYGIPIPGSDQEWLLIENREKTGVDAFFNGLPGEGIVIYQVDDKRPYGGRFNTLTSANRTHGIKFLALLTTDGKLTPDTVPSTLPYKKIDRVTPNLGIRGVSRPGKTMTFTLSFEKPKLPVVAVSDKLYLGKVEKNKTKSMELAFANVGSGTLHILIQPKEGWISLDRKSFIGNDESITVTVDATGLPLKKQTGHLIFSNAASETGGTITVEFEVTPIAGDLDRNDRVDDEDLEQFMKLYGLRAEDPGFKPEADFNSDSVIDFTDLLMLAKNYKAN